MAGKSRWTNDGDGWAIAPDRRLTNNDDQDRQWIGDWPVGRSPGDLPMIARSSPGDRRAIIKMAIATH